MLWHRWQTLPEGTPAFLLAHSLASDVRRHRMHFKTVTFRCLCSRAGAAPLGGGRDDAELALALLCDARTAFDKPAPAATRSLGIETLGLGRNKVMRDQGRNEAEKAARNEYQTCTDRLAHEHSIGLSHQCLHTLQIWTTIYA